MHEKRGPIGLTKPLENNIINNMNRLNVILLSILVSTISFAQEVNIKLANTDAPYYNISKDSLAQMTRTPPRLLAPSCFHRKKSAKAICSGLYHKA